MSSNTIFLVTCLAVILGLGAAKSTKGASNAEWWSAGSPIINYNCSNKVDGNYPHPTLCTHYVACVAETYAYEMVCALNHDGNPLHYVANSGPNTTTSHCDYPERAGCTIEQPEDPTTPKPEDPPTKAPPTDSPTTKAPPTPTDAPTTKDPITLPPPTEAPPGAECKEHDCRETGDCTSYEICQNGTWTKNKCKHDLFWNSEIDNGHGGTCDYYENLSNKLQDKYISDEECILPCAWWQTDKQVCTDSYQFRKPFDGKTLKNRETTLTCPKAPVGSSEPVLIWDQATLTCVHQDELPNCPPFP